MNVSHVALQQLASRIFAAAGSAPQEADTVARRLVQSNLVGHDSHGVIRVPAYILWVQEEKLVPNQQMEVVLDSGPLAVVDGRRGFGQVIGEQAVALGMEKARAHGVAVVGLRNSGHVGRVGDWAEMAAEANLVSLHFVNTSGSGILVAPTGGIQRRLSANPIAAGVPVEGRAPIILDISTCAIAEGKIRVALNQGVQVAEGCLVDSEGRPTTDPQVFYGTPPGSILPVGGHKGYGLGVVVDILAGALTGNHCSNPEHGSRLSQGMLSIYLDATAMQPAEVVGAEVGKFIDHIKTSKTVTPDEKILMPGEIESQTRQRRLAEGIPMDEATLEQIREVCQKLGVEESQVDALAGG